MTVAGTIRAAVRLAREEEITFLAAAIAYYAFVSLLPALLLALALASVLGGEALVESVLEANRRYLTPAGQEAVGEAITNARGRAGATVAGVAVLAWTVLRVFRGLDVAFAQVYGTPTGGSVVRQVRDAAVVVGSIGVGIGAMVAVGAALATTEPRVVRGVLGIAVLLIGLVVVFLPVYYVLPDRAVSVREALPGTVLAAGGWIVLQAAFQVYAAAAPRYDLYGVVGGVLLLVTWFYAAAAVVLFGAAVNVVLAEDRQVQHGRPRETT